MGWKPALPKCQASEGCQKEATPAISISEFTFKLKVRIITALQDAKHDSEAAEAFRKSLVSDLTAQISALNTERFEVRTVLRHVEKYSRPEAFQYLSIADMETLIQHLAVLVPASGDDESARRFDILVYRHMLAWFEADEGNKRFVVNKIKSMASALEGKFSLPDERRKKILLKKFSGTVFGNREILPNGRTCA